MRTLEADLRDLAHRLLAGVLQPRLTQLRTGTDTPPAPADLKRIAESAVRVFLAACQWPSSSPQRRPRISPLVAIFSPRWRPRISPPTD
jgi:hypothetical protein